MTAASLTNREIASLVLLGALLVVIIVAALRSERLGSVLGGLFRAFVQPLILLILVWYFGCLAAALSVASWLGLWEWSLWKPTVLWLVLTGFGLLFKNDEAIEQRWFVWRVTVI